MMLASVSYDDYGDDEESLDGVPVVNDDPSIGGQGSSSSSSSSMSSSQHNTTYHHNIDDDDVYSEMGMTTKSEYVQSIRGHPTNASSVGVLLSPYNRIGDSYIALTTLDHRTALS
ncbi:hypothetical protein FOZ63_005297 [Perkinsus olseni]|uniref:Uncharacterized protein n=1 Tax=Perkinsus olseni TaxID=32597 RepID=A0A7J6T906_PEROL|nr:hypothetical protein FOZ63_005297 [Perkinsus olseni]